MIELGLDIDEDILLRLEVNDLIRCKGVCKSWYSLISSGCFVKSQLNNNVRKKVDNNEIGDTRITALTCTSMCCIDRRRECQVVGSSNGPCDPVLVRSIEHSEDEFHHGNAHIRLSMNSECNYNYDHLVFVKSLVSPHGNGSSNEERVKRKRQNVISPDGDGRSMKSRRESFASHNSDGRRAKSKRQSHISSDSDDDGRGVERKRGERGRRIALCLIVPMEGELRVKGKAIYLLIPMMMEGEWRGEGGRGRGVRVTKMTMTMRGDTGEKGRN
nr:hypothetical protein [Tanacetum cinerariifolium]